MKAKHYPKDGKSRFENTLTQPLQTQRVFNNHQVLTKGWYPVCVSHKLVKGERTSFKLLKQRLVIFRGASGTVHALDAFCPHLGADLANGKVVGDNIQCYFHRWELNGKGNVCKVACLDKLDSVISNTKNNSYPVTEMYGHIWVFADAEVSHPMLKPKGLESSDVTAWYLKEITLFAHHHVMMANAVDLQHFATVHNLDIKFDYQIMQNEDGTFEWEFSGKIPNDNLKGRLARFFLGDTFKYHVKYGGGSTICINYGIDAKLLGHRIPSLNVLWGCLPQESGISKVRIFFVSKNRKGIIGSFKNVLLYFCTLLLLVMLRDEDIQAFPNMRFNTNRPIEADKALARFIQMINKQECSNWGRCS